MHFLRLCRLYFLPEILCLVLLTSLLSLSGCAFRKKTDPFEGVNRGVFLLNKTVDRLYVKPIACAYDKFLPKPFRYATHSFFQNLREIPTIINDVLQCKLRDARRAAARFALNTTWGVLGFIDVATLGKIERHQNDFGLTLAHYGYKESVYLVLPFFNSCTLRDGIGLWVDTYLGIWPYIKPPRVSWTLWAISLIDTRAKFLQAEPILEEAVVDEYTFMRDAYLQHRRYQMNIDKQPELGDIQALEMPDDNEASAPGSNKPAAGDMPDDNELLDTTPKVGAAAVAAVDIDETTMVVDNSLLEIKSKIVIVKTPYYAPCTIPCINPGKIPNPFKGEPDLIIIEKTKIYLPANPEDIKGTSTVTNAVGGRK